MMPVRARSNQQWGRHCHSLSVSEAIIAMVMGSKKDVTVIDFIKPLYKSTIVKLGLSQALVGL